MSVVWIFLLGCYGEVLMGLDWLAFFVHFRASEVWDFQEWYERTDDVELQSMTWNGMG